MKHRVKSEKPAIIPIGTFEEADTILREIGDLQMQINQAETTAKEIIDEAKAELAETVKPLQEQIRNKADSLEVFCSAHRSEFGNQQSRKLNFGSLGWRKSTSIILNAITLELIKRVFGKRADTYIRTKEEPDKEALASLKDEELKEVGARRKVKEIFYAEPALPEAVDYTE
jgi:phage host-nuclease inhibitor protein Gam